jgi:hypothetical protein
MVRDIAIILLPQGGRDGRDPPPAFPRRLGTLRGSDTEEKMVDGKADEASLTTTTTTTTRRGFIGRQQQQQHQE